MTYNQRRDGPCAAASQDSHVLVGCGHSAQGRWIGSWLGGPPIQGGSPEETGARPQLFLDPNKLVVLRQPVRAGEGAGLDLAAIGRDRKVGDRGVLGLPVRCDITQAIRPRQPLPSVRSRSQSGSLDRMTLTR